MLMNFVSNVLNLKFYSKFCLKKVNQFKHKIQLYCARHNYLFPESRDVTWVLTSIECYGFK